VQTATFRLLRTGSMIPLIFRTHLRAEREKLTALLMDGPVSTLAHTDKGNFHATTNEFY
jgi:hypothetical protein